MHKEFILQPWRGDAPNRAPSRLSILLPPWYLDSYFLQLMQSGPFLVDKP